MHITLKLSKRTLFHGLAIVVSLVVIQLLLEASRNSFLLFMPPIGFALFLFTMFGIQPIIIGVINVTVLHRFYNCDGWQIGFWTNGFFLFIVFSTINLMIHTIAGAPFSLFVGIPEIFLLSYPFGYLGKFSNRGCETPLGQPSKTQST